MQLEWASRYVFVRFVLKTIKNKKEIMRITVMLSMLSDIRWEKVLWKWFEFVSNATCVVVGIQGLVLDDWKGPWIEKIVLFSINRLWKNRISPCKGLICNWFFEVFCHISYYICYLCYLAITLYMYNWRNSSAIKYDQPCI